MKSRCLVINTFFSTYPPVKNVLFPDNSFFSSIDSHVKKERVRPSLTSDISRASKEHWDLLLRDVSGMAESRWFDAGRKYEDTIQALLAIKEKLGDDWYTISSCTSYPRAISTEIVLEYVVPNYIEASLLSYLLYGMNNSTERFYDIMDMEVKIFLVLNPASAGHLALRYGYTFIFIGLLRRHKGNQECESVLVSYIKSLLLRPDAYLLDWFILFLCEQVACRSNNLFVVETAWACVVRICDTVRGSQAEEEPKTWFQWVTQKCTDTSSHVLFLNELERKTAEKLNKI
jgi:hypothetical protein